MDLLPPLAFREPRLADAPSITALIRQCDGLDANSHYLSLLLCRHFRTTCVVAECRDRFAGFLSAYHPPLLDHTMFVWQVAVAAEFRGRGVASDMLDHLLSREACAEVRFVEATVCPSNRASQKLFRSFARRRGTLCRTSEGFASELFAGVEEHEPEELYRVGPLSPDGGD